LPILNCLYVARALYSSKKFARELVQLTRGHDGYWKEAVCCNVIYLLWSLPVLMFSFMCPRDKVSPSLRYWADGPTGKMSTRFWGVERKDKLGVWRAVLPAEILGRRVTVGVFSEELAAARARDAAVLSVMGPHDQMNWFVEEYSQGEVELAGEIMAARLKWEQQQQEHGEPEKSQQRQQQEQHQQQLLSKRVVAEKQERCKDPQRRAGGDSNQHQGIVKRGGSELRRVGNEQQQRQHTKQQKQLAGPLHPAEKEAAAEASVKKQHRQAPWQQRQHVDVVRKRKQGEAGTLQQKFSTWQPSEQQKQQSEQQQQHLPQKQQCKQHELEMDDVHVAVAPDLKRARTARTRVPGSKWRCPEFIKLEELGCSKGGNGMDWDEEEQVRGQLQQEEQHQQQQQGQWEGAEGEEEVLPARLRRGKALARTAGVQHGSSSSWQQLVQQVLWERDGGACEVLVGRDDGSQAMGCRDKTENAIMCDGQGRHIGAGECHSQHVRQQGGGMLSSRSDAGMHQDQQQLQQHSTTGTDAARGQLAIAASLAWHNAVSASDEAHTSLLATTAAPAAAAGPGRGLQACATQYLPGESVVCFALPTAWMDVLVEQEATSSILPGAVQADVSSCSSRAPQDEPDYVPPAGKGAAVSAAEWHVSEAAAYDSEELLEGRVTGMTADVERAQVAVGVGVREAAAGEAHSAWEGEVGEQTAAEGLIKAGAVESGEQQQQQQQLPSGRHRYLRQSSSKPKAHPAADRSPAQSTQGLAVTEGAADGGRAAATSGCCVQLADGSAPEAVSTSRQERRARSPSPSGVVSSSGKSGKVHPKKSGKGSEGGKAGKPPKYHWWQKFRSWNQAGYKAAAEATAAVLGCEVMPSGQRALRDFTRCIPPGDDPPAALATALDKGPAIEDVRPVAAGCAAVEVLGVQGGTAPEGCKQMCHGALHRIGGVAHKQPPDTSLLEENELQQPVGTAAAAGAAAAEQEVGPVVSVLVPAVVTTEPPQTGPAAAAAAVAAEHWIEPGSTKVIAAVSTPAAVPEGEPMELSQVGPACVALGTCPTCSVSCSSSLASDNGSRERAAIGHSSGGTGCVEDGENNDSPVRLAAAAAASCSGVAGAAAGSSDVADVAPGSAADAATAMCGCSTSTSHFADDAAVTHGCTAAAASTSECHAGAAGSRGCAAPGGRPALPEEACAELVVLVVLHERGWPNVQLWRQWESYHEGRVVVVAHFKAGLQLVAGVVGHEEISRRMLDTRVEAKWGDISLTGREGGRGYSFLHSCGCLKR
jgi:hypothetical protein